jgi:UDP-GlcNAc:undecaprenyl-phosphate GlcNAc-1-phosphate transferase
LDVPDSRRIHTVVTPSLGGVAIFFGFIVALIAWASESQKEILYPILTVLVIPFIIGLVDDVIHVKPIIKLVGQAITGTLIFFFLD